LSVGYPFLCRPQVENSFPICKFDWECTVSTASADKCLKYDQSRADYKMRNYTAGPLV
jgi:hypothetical protein